MMKLRARFAAGMTVTKPSTTDRGGWYVQAYRPLTTARVHSTLIKAHHENAADPATLHLYTHSHTLHNKSSRAFGCWPTR